MADRLSKQQRSFCMSRVKSKGTDLETLVQSELRKRKIFFKANIKSLPGSPDIVFEKKKVAVFIDGDFWHGYRFPVWKKNVSPFWRKKIALNRKRDLKNFRNIRRMGWTPIRLWQHELKNDFEKTMNKVLQVVKLRKITRKGI